MEEQSQTVAELLPEEQPLSAVEQAQAEEAAASVEPALLARCFMRSPRFCGEREVLLQELLARVVRDDPKQSREECAELLRSILSWRDANCVDEVRSAAQHGGCSPQFCCCSLPAAAAAVLR